MLLIDIKNKFQSEFRSFFSSDEEMNSQFWMISEELFKVEKLRFLIERNIQIEEDKVDVFNNYCKRLKNNEPVQYILGKAYFYGDLYMVDKNVLIPRPETEELVEWIINDHLHKKVSILDVATGSGCIAIALQKNKVQSEVHAIDISKEALAVAAKNNSIVSNKVIFSRADALKLSGNTELGNRKWDVIVSNPPYVMEKEQENMKTNVIGFEPHLALFVSDNDPLVFYRSIMKYAYRNLNENGSLYFEINQELNEEMLSLAKDIGFTKNELRKDFRNNYRMMKLKR